MPPKQPHRAYHQAEADSTAELEPVIPPLSCADDGPPCSRGQQLDRMEATQRKILEALGDGRVNFATLGLRLRALELIVYGGCAAGLTYLGNALLALVGGGKS